MPGKPKLKKSEVTLLLMSGACIAGYFGYRAVNPSAPGVDLQKAGINIPGAPVQLTGGAGAGAALLGGSEPAPMEELPAIRRDPFTPLGEGTEAAPGSGTGGAPASTPPPSVPPVTAQAPPAPVPQPVPVPEPPKPEIPPQPATLVGTIMGQEALATFEYGAVIVERRLGEHVGPYRIAEIDHGRVRLVGKDGGESWLMSGQTLTEAGVTVKGESSQAAPAPVPAAPVPATVVSPALPPEPRERPKAKPSSLPVATQPADEPFYVAQEPSLGGPLPLLRTMFPDK